MADDRTDDTRMEDMDFHDDRTMEDSQMEDLSDTLEKGDREDHAAM